MNCKYISNRFLLYHLILSQFMMIGCHFIKSLIIYETNNRNKAFKKKKKTQKSKSKHYIQIQRDWKRLYYICVLTGMMRKYPKAIIPSWITTVMRSGSLFTPVTANAGSSNWCKNLHQHLYKMGHPCWMLNWN